MKIQVRRGAQINSSGVVGPSCCKNPVFHPPKPSLLAVAQAVEATRSVDDENSRGVTEPLKPHAPSRRRTINAMIIFNVPIIERWPRSAFVSWCIVL